MRARTRTVVILYLVLIVLAVLLALLSLSNPVEGMQIVDGGGAIATATAGRARIHAPVPAGVDDNPQLPTPTPWGGWNEDGFCDRDCVVLCGPNLSEEQCTAYQVQMTAQASEGEDPYPAPETTPETGYPAP